MEIAFVLIGLIFVAIGVILIYDARLITKKMFSFQDINEGAKTLKILGFLISILGGGIIYIYFPTMIDIIKVI